MSTAARYGQSETGFRLQRLCPGDHFQTISKLLAAPGPAVIDPPLFRSSTHSSQHSSTMTNWLISILSPAVLLACVYLYRKCNAYSRFRAAAIKHGCQRPRRYPHRDPVWGYDLYREREKAMQCGRLLRLHERHFDLYGKTFEERFFDANVINTMEAANVQQVASASFQDWGKVSSRSISASPVLGRGIFSADGVFWRHSRDLVKPTFARSEISDFNSLGTFVDRLLEMMPDSGTTIDIQPLLHKLVMITLVL